MTIQHENQNLLRNGYPPLADCETLHTPGPWAALDRNENSRTLTHVTNGAHIVCTLGTTRTDGSPNHSANAAIIAAAPELLSALRELLDWGLCNLSPVHNPDAHQLLVTADAAIAKAEGGAK